MLTDHYLTDVNIPLCGVDRPLCDVNRLLCNVDRPSCDVEQFRFSFCQMVIVLCKFVIM